VNRIIDPHAIGGHSVACENRGVCVHGIEFCYRNPFVVQMPDDVSWAESLLKTWGVEKALRLGDCVPFRKITVDVTGNDC
jgi:hypothetical protein